MYVKFFIVIFSFLFTGNIYCLELSEPYKKYSSDFEEINQKIFQTPLLSVLSYNIDLVINTQEKTFSTNAVINLLITEKSISDTFYFSLDKKLSIEKIECDDYADINWEFFNAVNGKYNLQITVLLSLVELFSNSQFMSA